MNLIACEECDGNWFHQQAHFQLDADGASLDEAGDPDAYTWRYVYRCAYCHTLLRIEYADESEASLESQGA